MLLHTLLIFSWYYYIMCGRACMCEHVSPPPSQVPASQLIHPSKEPTSIRLWHDQLFAKPPKHGGVVAWWVKTSNVHCNFVWVIIMCMRMCLYVRMCVCLHVWVWVCVSILWRSVCSILHWQGTLQFFPLRKTTTPYYDYHEYWYSGTTISCLLKPQLTMS